MYRRFFSSLVPAKCVGIVSLALLTAVTPATIAGDWSPQTAADYLDGRADWWLRWDTAARGNGTACLSCHTAVPFALGRSALGRRVGESEAQRRMVAGVARRVANWDKIVSDGSDGGYAPFYGGDRKRSAVATESVLNALVLVDADVRSGRPLGEAARCSDPAVTTSEARRAAGGSGEACAVAGEAACVCIRTHSATDV